MPDHSNLLFEISFLNDYLSLPDRDFYLKYKKTIPMDLDHHVLLAIVKDQKLESAMLDPYNEAGGYPNDRRVQLVQTGTATGPFEVYACNDRGGTDFGKTFYDLDEAVLYKWDLILNDLKALRRISELMNKKN